MKCTEMQRSFRSTPLIIITGPTASGKSGLGTLLAEAINGVIINGDMAQMYEPLTIGTAKPAWRQERVPHLLFDSICEPRDSSALEFREKATQAVRDVVAAGGVPIVVGGSFFHISTLFFKLDDGSFGSSSQGSSRTSNEVDKPSPEETQRLWHKLAAIDSKRASQIDRHDSYRIARALALAEHKTPSECAPQFDPIYNNCMLIHLTRDRAELYERINERVSVMLADGWLKEVRDLDSSWRSWLRQKKIIGYDTLLDCLESAEEEG